jgi:hypothetical protein
MGQEWKDGIYDIAIKEVGKETKEPVSGIVYGVWGIHWEKGEGIYVLTYVPNGKAVLYGSKEKIAVLKQAALDFDTFLKDGKLPSSLKEMKQKATQYMGQLV